MFFIVFANAATCITPVFLSFFCIKKDMKPQLHASYYYK
ncbi:hypothetical protein C2W63_00127 [Bacillus velezensis]|nr:hypothetical protein C2W63_00127 [Bacillus velezensis]